MGCVSEYHDQHAERNLQRVRSEVCWGMCISDRNYVGILMARHVDLDAKLVSTGGRLVENPSHVFLYVRIKVFVRSLGLPLNEFGPFDAMGWRSTAQ